MHQPYAVSTEAADAGAAWLELGVNEEGHKGRKNNDQEELLSGASLLIHY